MYQVVKRLLAILISGLAIIILSPVLLAVAIAIKCDSKGPVLFKQKRVGKDKQHFMIYKFRSMYVDAPADMPTHMLKDPTAMITKVGAFLRKTSLDELPQLFTILICIRAGLMDITRPLIIITIIPLIIKEIMVRKKENRR